MDAIETAIRLPAGAHPINAYSRVYAYAPNHRVIAIYFLPSEPEEALCKSETELAKHGEIASRFCRRPKGLIAGERRWISDYRLLPGAYDGGCALIDVRYNLRSMAFEQAECHGKV